MSLNKRLRAMLCIVIGAVLVTGIAKSGTQIADKSREELIPTTDKRETLYLWYSDEALTSYLSGAAVTYNETHDVRIVPVLEAGPEYLERINRASVEENMPELYVLGHDSLEKAYLAGLAAPVQPPGQGQMAEAYMETGLNAVTYKDKLIGYPFYFETSSLLYNKSYIKDMAEKLLEEEADQAEGEEAQAAAEENPPEEESKEDTETAMPAEQAAAQFSQEEIEAKMKEILPATIEDIKSFADSYDAPEQVEGVFKWDVTDIFYNYFFVGSAIDIGGEAGWDSGRIDIYNEDAVKSLQAYQELNQFFSIDTSEISYEKVLDEFMEGKIVFTVATTDAVARLEQAAEDGLFPYEYGITKIPDIDDTLSTRSLSMTNCVVVNGYGRNQEAANDFAWFLTTQYSDILYARTGKAAAARNVDYGYEALGEFAAEYERSISMPKLLETSNFWVQLEVVFSRVWNGADVEQLLSELSEQMKKQI